MIIHHGPSAREVAEHLGYVVEVELTSGKVVIGRVEAVDEHTVYLGRTELHPTIILHDIKRVDRR
jgi:small nuclear ribonucleoprotein (snRNP)-like protein